MKASERGDEAIRFARRIAHAVDAANRAANARTPADAARFLREAAAWTKAAEANADAVKSVD